MLRNFFELTRSPTELKRLEMPAKIVEADSVNTLIKKQIGQTLD